MNDYYLFYNEILECRVILKMLYSTNMPYSLYKVIKVFGDSRYYRIGDTVSQSDSKVVKINNTKLLELLYE